MQLLTDYLNDAQLPSKNQFLEKHPHPVFVHRFRKTNDYALSLATVASPQSDPRRQSTEQAMITLNLANTRALVYLTQVLSRLGNRTESPEGTVVVFPIRSKSRASVVTLGRDPQSDVILPFPKISKCHARFTFRAHSYEISDAGSKNGLMVSGVKAAGGQWIPLINETVVSFAEYPFIFYEPIGFYHLLRGGA